MINGYVTLAFGVICAAISGEIFVRGTVGLAHRARVSPGIIGATVAAFATSSPELAVSISAALAGKPHIERRRRVLLLILYGAYLVTILQGKTA